MGKKQPVVIDDDPLFKPKVKKERMNYSLFFITINSNKLLDREQQTKFINFTERVMNDKDLFVNNYFGVREKNDKEKWHYLTEEEKRQIIKFERVNPRKGYEVAAKPRRYHVHIVIKVAHHLMLKCLVPNIQDSYTKLLGYKPGKHAYAACTPMPDTQEYIKQYAEKND